jgi:hypothetical protein
LTIIVSNDFYKANPSYATPKLSPLSEFHPFPRLPKEVRLKIWKSVHEANERGERVVEITFEWSIQQVVSLSPAPVLLHVCRETREEYGKIFKVRYDMIDLLYQTANTHWRLSQTLPQRTDLPPIFLRPERDICLVREDRDAVLSREGRLLNAIFADPENPATRMLFGIKHLCIEFWVVARLRLYQHPPLPDHLHSLESVEIVFTLVRQPSKPSAVRQHSYEPKQITKGYEYVPNLPLTLYSCEKFLELDTGDNFAMRFFTPIFDFLFALVASPVYQGIQSPYMVRFYGTEADIQWALPTVPKVEMSKC